MPPDIGALSERVSVFYPQLVSVAEDLNAASDELGKCIMKIDESLRKLNLGITVWVRIQYWDDTDLGGMSFKEEQLGYTRVSGEWGVCIRRVKGEMDDSDKAEEIWLFKDAPRSLRLLSIDKIPNLIERLIGEAQIATRNIQAKLADAKAVAAALNPIVPPSRFRGLTPPPKAPGGQR